MPSVAGLGAGRSPGEELKGFPLHTAPGTASVGLSQPEGNGFPAALSCTQQVTAQTLKMRGDKSAALPDWRALALESDLP